MSRKLFLLFSAVFFMGIIVFNTNAQTSRKAVSGAEVTGTFRSYFTGKFKGSYNEIKILALGKGKLKVGFELSYPYITPRGEMSANVGATSGEAEIAGDTAVFSDSEFGECKITIKFVKAGLIKVSQESDGSGCGFGFNVAADGNYKKVSGAKPTF